MNYETTIADHGTVTIQNTERKDSAMVSDGLIVLIVKRSDTNDLKARLEDLANQALQHVAPPAE